MVCTTLKFTTYICGGLLLAAAQLQQAGLQAVGANPAAPYPDICSTSCLPI